LLRRAANQRRSKDYQRSRKAAAPSESHDISPSRLNGVMYATSAAAADKPLQHASELLSTRQKNYTICHFRRRRRGGGATKKTMRRDGRVRDTEIGKTEAVCRVAASLWIKL